MADWKMDSFDRKILTCLQDEPQLTIGQVAERVGLSHTPCWRRLKRMEEQGVVLGRPFMLDPVALGFPITVFAHIKIKDHQEAVLEAFEIQVCRHPEIVTCFSMSGESDYVLRVLARSIEDYESFLKRVLLHLPGVGSVNSSFAMKQVKLSVDVPL